MSQTSEKILEPERHKVACVYCADAPINHKIFYFASLLSMALDNHILKVTKHAPGFLKDFVDWLLYSFFNLMLFVRVAGLSDDIDQAKTFRSRVIWEEARRRGIEMQQVMMFGHGLDQYRAKINGKTVYFNSLPIPQKMLSMKQNWDDKYVLKKEFSKNNIPVPEYLSFPIFYPQNLEKIFSKLKKPVIVKPRVGSRGRHTVTNINTLEQFSAATDIAKQICSFLVAEEHLQGYVCRATLVNGKLMGFYRGGSPFITGDGVKTISELIKEKDESRHKRVQKVLINQELENYIGRSGFKLDDVLPKGMLLPLTHRTGRFWGGITKEMLDDLHPSFIPIIEEAARIVNLPVIGFDCIVPDPTASAESQRWGIIECNTLPFIDLHYYALEGQPKNIAGAIWDMWQ